MSPATAAKAPIAAQSLTAEDTLQRKQRHKSVVSGGRPTATARKSEAVDTIFTRCGSHIFDIYEGCIASGICVIDARRAPVAAHATDGYARHMGKPGLRGDCGGARMHERRHPHCERVSPREPNLAFRWAGRIATTKSRSNHRLAFLGHRDRRGPARARRTFFEPSSGSTGVGRRSARIRGVGGGAPEGRRVAHGSRASTGGARNEDLEVGRRN